MNKQELQRLCDAATPGPWFREGNDVTCQDPNDVDDSRICVASVVDWGLLSPEHLTNDAAFIAAARTAIPELLAELAAVTAERDGLWEALEKLARLGNGDRYGNSEGNMIAQAVLAKYAPPKEPK